MKRLLNLTLLLAFCCCYLQWPPDNALFIFQAEHAIFTNGKNWVANFTHPVILIGLMAQLLLLYSAIRKDTNKKINNLGVFLLTPVVLLFLLVGILAGNYKIILSTLPYLFLVVVYFVIGKRTKLKNRPVTKADSNQN